VGGLWLPRPRSRHHSLRRRQQRARLRHRFRRVVATRGNRAPAAPSRGATGRLRAVRGGVCDGRRNLPGNRAAADDRGRDGDRPAGARARGSGGDPAERRLGDHGRRGRDRNGLSGIGVARALRRADQGCRGCCERARSAEGRPRWSCSPAAASRRRSAGANGSNSWARRAAANSRRRAARSRRSP